MATLIELAKKASKELKVGNPRTIATDTYDHHNRLIHELDAAIEQAEKVEPVAWLPSTEWTPCVKLPVTVHVRQQREGETHVSTREGITPVKPDDLIMRGVSGEEYPIGREIFEKTYRIGEHPTPAVPEAQDIHTCPKCGGEADNGFSREIPPAPYFCTKCMGEMK